MRRGLPFVLILLVGGLARAEDAKPSEPAPGDAPPAPPAAPAPPPAAKPASPRTSEQVADAVSVAITGNDDVALKALAAKDDPDPWLVADELMRRGAFDAADAFAKAAPRADVEGLPGYIASRRGKPDNDAARRERLAQANVALLSGKMKDALDALGGEEPGPIDALVGIRLAMGRGFALDSLTRLEPASAAFAAAGEAAERWGWLTRAAAAWSRAGMAALRGAVFPAARAAFERCAEVCERRGDRAGAARSLGGLGSALLELGEHTKAIETYERALALQEALGDHASAATTLGILGDVHYGRRDYPSARTSLERALAAHESLGDRAGVMRVLNNLAGLHFSLGDYVKALAIQQRVLAAHEALGDKASTAFALGNIGAIYRALGDYAQVLVIQEQVRAAYESLGDRAGAAQALGNIGVAHVALGDYAQALAIQEQVLAVTESLGDKARTAHALDNLGVVYLALGDYAKALAAFERALVAMEAVGDRVGAASTRCSIGNVHAALGHHAKALAIQERALAAQEAMGDRAGVSGTLVSIGNVHAALADYPKALAVFERAVEVAESLGNKAWVATLLGNIGNVYLLLGEHEQALATQERALAAHEAVGSKVGVSRALVNIGNAHADLGDHAKALAIQGQALAALEALGDQAAAVGTLVNIGLAHLALEDTPKAVKALERAARDAEKLGSNNLRVAALRGLAQARLKSGDVGRAMSDAHRAVLLLKTLVGGLGDEQGATARSKYVDLFSTGFVAAAKADDAAEAAFFLESGRAGTLLEALDGRDTLRRAALPEPLRLALARARAAEAHAFVAYGKAEDGGDFSAIRTASEALKAARATMFDVNERIQRDAKKAARLWYPEASPIEDLQGFLAPGEAFVLYGLAERDNHAIALVLTSVEARIVALGKSSEIVSACESFDPTDREADSAPAFDRLRALLIQPLKLATETKRLFISPEGPVSYVPFAVLVPDLEIAYEPSGTTYGVLLEEENQRGTQVLALGDPDYAAKFNPVALDLYAPVAVTGATRGGRLVPLPGTREEARAIGDVTLFGKDASESGLRAAIAKKGSRWHSVHIACHGLVDPDRPTLSSLALTPNAEDDGFLTALEVLQMEIPSDLVVLSACETGKGKIVGGEGLVGLTRAFMYAGSPRVICSLWKVDDQATRALMTKFYELWNPKDGKPGLPTAEALRKSQDFVRSHEKWKHPYYWAAWVLWGLPS